MAFATKAVYVGDGVLTQFNVPFQYIASTHISVFVNEVLQLTPMHYTLAGSTVTFNDPVPVDDAIEIKRNTSPTALLVDFQDGSVLNESDLDTAYQHNFFLYEEAVDSFNELINNALLQVASGTGITEIETPAVIAALVNEMLNTDAAATLQARVSDIDTNAESILSLGQNLQVQINTLAGLTAAAIYIQAAEPVPGVGGIPDPIPEGARWYDSDDNNAPYIYQSSAWVSIEDPRIGQAVADISVLQTDVNDNAAAVVTESLARSNADTALASTLALIGAQNGAQTAFIVDTATVKIDSDVGDTFATRLSALSTADSDNSAAITAEQSARITADGVTASTIALIGAENVAGTAFIIDENTVKIESDTGDTLAERFTALSAATDSVAASVASEITARVAGDSANASAITSLTATVGTNTSGLASANVTIAANVTAIAGAEGDVATLYAKYGVQLDVNGYVTGFAQNNDGTSGSFVIMADKFAIQEPGSAVGTGTLPFLVTGGVVKMQNVEITGSLLLNGTVVGSALVAGTIGSTQIGANAITTTQLNANSISAVKIQANAITADKINVTNLAAITADIGNITAGTITLNTTGYIKGGQTAYNTGDGFFLGYDGADYKFSIGDGGVSDFITWDGTTMVIRGNVSIGSYTLHASTVLLAANTERSSGLNWPTWVEVKKFEINRPGTIRCVTKVRMGSTTGGVVNASGYRWKLDGVVKHTSSWSNSTYSSDRSFDMTTLGTSTYITLEVQPGEHDTTEPVSTRTYVKDVQLRATKSDGESVVTD